LAICQVSDELVELIGAVDEVGVFDDFAKYEGIFAWRPISSAFIDLPISPK
jgi:hypothetical protein